jgi:mono/diheme cytochrome c family protein
MYDQPKYEPLEASTFFDDGQASRPLVAGTVARGHLRLDQAFYTGKVGKQFVEEFPQPVTRQTLERGRERFNIYCSVCHGQVGNGDGMVVRRGFRKPPSLHIDRLRGAPVGHLYDVIMHGFGAMPGYAKPLPPEDRWAIVAYIRALQLSQYTPVASLPEEKQKELSAGNAP